MGSPAYALVGQWMRTVTVGRHPRWTVVRIVVLVVSTFLLFHYVVLLRKIESISMLPTFKEGSVHGIYRWAYGPGAGPQRGDIIGIRTSGETVMYVKRVIALPGETIAIRAGVVHINGQPLEEPYVRVQRRPWNYPERRLESDQYMIIGDNRSMGQDQHEFGVIRAERVAGKVIW